MTPGNLVRAVADAFDTPESDVSQYDRRLQEAGLRTTGGRGSSAPDVRAEDVARLLIATLMRNRHAQTVATVKEWWDLFLVSDAALQRKPNAKLPPRVREAAANASCTFGTAFTAIIEDCISGEMESFLGPAPSWGAKFSLKIIRQDLRVEVGLLGVEMAFQGAMDIDEPPRKFLTYIVPIDPLLGIAKQMRG